MFNMHYMGKTFQLSSHWLTGSLRWAVRAELHIWCYIRETLRIRVVSLSEWRSAQQPAGFWNIYLIQLGRTGHFCKKISACVKYLLLDSVYIVINAFHHTGTTKRKQFYFVYLNMIKLSTERICIFIWLWTWAQIALLYWVILKYLASP